MSERDPLHLFEATGIELEYMIVSNDSLSVRPIADELLKEVGGGYDLEVELGDVAWSNELALHVIEMKTNGPRASLHGLAKLFQEHIGKMHELLAPHSARLLGTAMHPWMDPHEELRLWPHENDIIYQTFHRIFDCRGHGWANLQSMHINLPFANDGEFARLHAAIRLILPLLPGLAASSPFMDGRQSADLDARLAVYRTNARRVPSVSGIVVPEPCYSRHEYENGLLRGIYDDLAPLDPQGILHHEWVNARGCIARFDRMAIEIRVLDVQECPRADIAIAGAVIAVVRALVDQAWSSTRDQQSWDERELAAVLGDGIRAGDEAVVRNRRVLDAFGYPERGAARLGELWQHLIESVVARDPGYADWQEALALIIGEGCLARRIVKAAGRQPSRARLRETYERLADCLRDGQLFRVVS